MSGFNANLLNVNPQRYTTNGLGLNHDVPLQSSVILVTPGAGSDIITGLLPMQQFDGLLCYLYNIDSVLGLLLQTHASSASGFRILMPPGLTTLTIPALGSERLILIQGLGWLPHRPGTYT